MISEYTDRRNILRAVGIGVAVSLAGCSESDSAEAPEGSGDSTQTDEGTESLTSDDESSGSGTSEDSTPQTETGQGQQPYEQNESDAEVEYETGLDTGLVHGWVEMENPEDQLNQANIDEERFPTLELLTAYESSSDHEPYNPGEALYLGWKDEGPQTVTVVQIVNKYIDNGENDLVGSTSGYINEDADIAGILREVVEGYDDVSENMPEEYVEALRS